MTNPMMTALAQNRLGSQLAPIKQLMGTLKAAQNPQAALGQMLAGNPAYRQVEQLVRQNGGDARAAFYALAGQMGVDPNEVINALK